MPDPTQPPPPDGPVTVEWETPDGWQPLRVCLPATWPNRDHAQRYRDVMRKVLGDKVNLQLRPATDAEIAAASQ